MRKARLAVHHRSACSGVKALRNTSAARRQAAKLCCRFGPLTPTLVRPGSRALDILCVLASPGGKLVTIDELVPVDMWDVSALLAAEVRSDG